MSSAMPSLRRRRRRWPWVALLVLALAGTGVGVGLASRNGEAGGAGDALRLEDLDLRVGEASLADIQVTVHEVGTIEPVVRVDVKSTLSGKVTELLVREGDQVRRGQVLARVEPDVNQAQTLSAVLSEKKLAEIRVDDARQDLETRERLYREGYVSDQELKDFRVDLDTALEALDAVRAKMRIVEASGIPLDQEFSTSQRVNIVSPMDGTVIEKNVEVGQTVSSGLSSFNDGTVLYTVADLQAMRIEAAVNEVDIGRVREDMPVVVTVDAFPYRRFEGVVTHISAAARLKDKVRVFDVEVTLNRRVPELRAGMTANIEVRGDRVEHVLSVPVEGIFKNGDRDVVYVVRKVVEEPKQGDRKPRRLKSGKFDVSDVWQRYFEEHPVKVGLTSLERAQILEGLEAGAELALEDPTRPRQIEEE